jgi:hypothetical protein
LDLLSGILSWDVTNGRHMKGVVEKEKARGRLQQRGRADGTFGTMF